MNKLSALIGFIITFGLLVLPASSSAAAAPDAKTCATQLTSIVYRADILQFKQQQETKNHAQFQKKWQKRIAYAGQWVTTAAEDTRDSLYEADALHKTKIAEINTQINTAKKYRSTKLTCAASSNEIAKLATGLKGTGSKPLRGDARISELQKKEKTFKNKDFKNQSQTMLKDLHAKKEKNPQPLNPKLQVN